MNKKSLKTLLVISSIMLSYSGVQACTNFLITAGASKDGSTFVTYAADSHTLYGELYYRPAATYSEGTMMDVYEWDTGKKLGQIRQATKTYSVVGNMNEHQLVIGETTYGGIEELHDKDGLIDYGSLIYITLQRAKNCREAIKIMAELIAEYGYCSEGESFSLADGKEVWIWEMIGTGKKVLDKNGNPDAKKNFKSAVWVARRIPDGYICGHANQARITTFPKEDGKTSISSKNLSKIMLPTVETVYFSEVINYARNIGLYSGTDEAFSFSDVYNPVTFSGARYCESRVWAAFMHASPSQMKQYEDYARGENLKHRMPLWIKPDKLLGVEDVMSLMRDHFEGTSMDMTKDVGAGPYACPYRWRPMEWTCEGGKYLHERATSTQQTGFSFVAQSRSKYPAQVGGVFWFGVDDTYSTVYMPIFCGITQIPYAIKEGNGNMLHYSSTSAFWLFNQVSNFAYSRYSDMIVDIQKVQKELESDFISQVNANTDKFVALWKQDTAKCIVALNGFSNKAVAETFNKWKSLSEYLLVKYMDGNVKKEKDGKFLDNGFDPKQPQQPEHPQYPQWYYKFIIDNAGHNLRYLEDEKK